MHKLMLIFPFATIVRINGIQDVFRQSNLYQKIYSSVDVPMMRHMCKRPLRSFLIGGRHVVKISKATHGTVRIAAYRYTPLFEASEVEAAFICRKFNVAADVLAFNEA